MEEKINLQKYLSDNNSSLYEYLKKEIAKAIKVDDLKNVLTLYFRNEDFMGSYFGGSLYIKFGAKDYHDCESRPDIVLNSNYLGYDECLNYLKRYGYYYKHQRCFNDDNPYDVYDRYDYSYERKRKYYSRYNESIGRYEVHVKKEKGKSMYKLKEGIGFNLNTNYFDYCPKDNKYNPRRRYISEEYSHMFCNDEYLATEVNKEHTSFIASLSPSNMKHYKEHIKDDISRKFCANLYRDFDYNKEEQDELKSKMFEFSKSVLQTYKNVVDVFKKSISKSSIICDGALDLDTNFIVEKNEIMFKDNDEEKDKDKRKYKYLTRKCR